jgi:2,3-diketo-5-methylthio-1-phosphopentane phosphatase
MIGPRASNHDRILVSDFDGTMTRYDFYKLALESLLPPDVPDYWADYRAETITHFEALQRYFRSIRSSEAEVLSVVERMELDPQLFGAVSSLQRSGWRVIVASAGCDWYIHRLLGEAGVKVEIHANPGHFEAGKGLLMEMATRSPFWSPELGVDKSGIVRDFLNQGRTVAFAGDGYPDADPARLVPAGLRFARGDLAEVLRGARLPFHSFESWSDIAEELVRQGP